MKKQVILLNGPSSSGKSTLSKALQALIREQSNELYPVVSIDDFMKISTSETIYEDDVYEINGEMCEYAREQLQTYPGVIIDHVITSQRIYQQLTELLTEHRLHAVRVRCPLKVLLQREAARKNRCIGSAEASYQYLYPQDGYDTAVDTHANSSAECAQQIYDHIKKSAC